MREKGIYVHVDEKEENGSLAAVDHLFEEETWLREQEPSTHLISAQPCI